MTHDTQLALDLIARTKAILNSISDDERALGDAYAALEAADSTHWNVDTSKGVTLHSSRISAAWHSFRDGNGYVFSWRNSCETLEIDLRWLKRIFNSCWAAARFTGQIALLLIILPVIFWCEAGLSSDDVHN